jgi:ribosomal protein L9
MKVILKEDIKGVGKKGDVINASDGYARNYLLPRGFGAEASEGNMAMLNEKKSSERFKKANELQEARDLAKKLSGITVRFKVKTGDNGRLFGSITSKDIADQIKTQHKIEVEKRKIVLDEPIKSAGVYNIEVKVYPDVSAKLKVEVIGE